MPHTYDYNPAQQIYCLSAASNAAGSTAGTQQKLQAAMKTVLQDTLPELSGDWEVSWGPKVYCKQPDNDKGYVDNVWFAAASESQKRVVVAIAGTAPPSIDDLLQDVDVFEGVDLGAWYGTWKDDDVVKEPPVVWLTDLQQKMSCASGTATGVWNVLSHEAPRGCPGEGTYLYDYLQAIDKKPGWSIIFTGHSMGGAITPVLALGLLTWGKLSPGCHHFTMASAGPSTTNDVFSAEFHKEFPADRPAPVSPPAYAAFNTDLYNTQDIVPQAWSLDLQSDRNIGNITNHIYVLNRGSRPGTISDDVWEYLAGATLLSVAALSRYSAQYSCLQGTPFTGRKIAFVSSLDELKASVEKQHTKEYWHFIGIQDFESQFEKQLFIQPGVVKPEPRTPKRPVKETLTSLLEKAGATKKVVE